MTLCPVLWGNLSCILDPGRAQGTVLSGTDFSFHMFCYLVEVSIVAGRTSRSMTTFLHSNRMVAWSVWVGKDRLRPSTVYIHRQNGQWLGTNVSSAEFPYLPESS